VSFLDNRRYASALERTLAGISGSTVLEDFVRVGGQAAMAGHLRIGRGAQIGAQGGVISDMSSGATVLNYIIRLS
jgi:UDP-3-O-[3-hydroxymyristoyl] glucosamine N-acyltransferase